MNIDSIEINLKSKGKAEIKLKERNLRSKLFSALSKKFSPELLPYFELEEKGKLRIERIDTMYPNAILITLAKQELFHGFDDIIAIKLENQEKLPFGNFLIMASLNYPLRDTGFYNPTMCLKERVINRNLSIGYQPWGEDNSYLPVQLMIWEN